MAVPDDYDAVMDALRLGWYIAEVRGRNEGRAPLPVDKPPKRTRHALPLRIERSPDELRIEAQKVLGALAGRLKVDADSASKSSFSDEVDGAAKALAGAAAAPALGSGTISPAQAPAVPAAVASAGTATADASGTPGVVDSTAPSPTATASPAGAADGGGLDSLEELIFRFDAHIQDTLAAESDTVVCAYQLGRALAECYWALDPNDADGWASWSFLHGPERRSEIGRLLGRLSAYFHTYTAPAVAGSVAVWGNVAASSEWRNQASAYPALYQQVRRWYGLILLKQNPTTLIKPNQVLKDIRLVWRAVRLFWPQLLLAALAAAALAGFAYLLSASAVNSAAATVLGALGITGFSVAGLAAKVKNDAQAALTRLTQDAYTDLIAVAITTAPPPPASAQPSGPFRPRTPEELMTSMVQDRRITPVTPG